MDGERNYHIFYQLLRGANDAIRQSLKISNRPSDYSYLSHLESIVSGIDDAEEFSITTSCMESVGLNNQAQLQVFSLLAGMLFLGNVVFKPDDNEGQVGGVTTESQQAFDIAASLLGVEGQDLLFSLTKQNMHVGGHTIVKMQTQAQAYDKRDSVSKSVYTMLFAWLVESINQTISAPDNRVWGRLTLHLNLQNNLFL